MKAEKQLLIELYDVKTEKFVKEIDISNYNLDTINKICPPEDQFDIEYTDGIDVSKTQFFKLKKIIIELNNVIYDNYIVNIITRRI